MTVRQEALTDEKWKEIWSDIYGLMTIQTVVNSCHDRSQTSAP
jgi:hypothetical protein